MFGTQTRGAAVVLDVQTGDVLALASAPAFEPAEFMGRISNEHWTNVLNHPIQKPLLNRATQENYHPGSILKMLTALAALEMEALDPKLIFNVEPDPERPGKGCIQDQGHRRARPLQLQKGAGPLLELLFHPPRAQARRPPKDDHARREIPPGRAHGALAAPGDGGRIP
jgi:hypothetical protein